MSYRVERGSEDNMTSGEALTILYVEDDPEAFLIVKTILKRKIKEKIDIRWADSGKDALKKIAHGHVDLIFLDYLLPDMDGLTALDKIRSAGITAPAVLLTGHGGEDVAAAAFKKGVIDYMPKRFENLDSVAARLLSSVKCAAGMAKVWQNTQSFTDLTRNRDSQVILADMLRTAANGAKKTHLLHKANLNSASIKKYISYAVSNDYMQVRSEGHTGIYVTTPKGMELLSKMSDVHQLLI